MKQATAQIYEFPTRGDPWMTLQQAATYTGFSSRSIQHAVKKEGLPGYRPFGPNGRLRFRRSEVDAWMQRRKA